MTRRVRGGLAGGSVVSGLQTFDTRITTAQNRDITVDPVGTGRFIIDSDAQVQNQGSLRFADSDSSNWVAFRSAAVVNNNVTWTLPATDGSNTFVLTTDGAGTLSWTSKEILVENNETDSNQNFIFFSPASSGGVTAARVSTSNLTFQPSTGTFTATALVESSSIELKENVLPIDNALDSILKLEGVIYDRKDGSKKGEAGLIAESVDEVLPNLVTKDNTGKPIGINYTKLTAYLIESIKTLKGKIDQLSKG